MPLRWLADLRQDSSPIDPYLRIEADRIVMTAELLAERIEYRLPGRGICQVAKSLRRVAGDAVARSRDLQRPNVPLRVICGLLIAAMLGTAGKLAFHLRFTDADGWSMLEGIEAGIGTIVYLALGTLFVMTIEGRIRRARTLRAVQELRALAHVIDMHQLAKDPERLANRYSAGAEYDTTHLNPEDLGRYLDYCSDLLSIVGKVAVLYAHDSNDGVVLGAVDEVERLTTGLSGKIWQKIMILDQIIEGQASRDGAAPSAHGAPEKNRTNR